MKISNPKTRSIGAWLVLAALLAAPAALIAHEGHHHQAMGTVKMVHENHLMLKDTDGKEQTFVITESTKFLRGDAATTKDDVTAGERAVVMYETEDGVNQALEVKLGEKKP